MPHTLLEPKEITLTDKKGRERVYTISEFPAVQGREIIAKYPLTAIPKVSDYKSNEDTMLKLMNFVAATDPNGNKIRLSNITLINNHVPDWELLAKLELAMLEYNCSFFLNGNLKSFLDDLPTKFLGIATKILMDSLAQSLPATEQP